MKEPIINPPTGLSAEARKKLCVIARRVIPKYEAQQKKGTA